MKNLLVLALVGTIAIPAFSKEAPKYAESVPKPTISELPYGTHKRQVLDFWKAESDKPTPLILVIHGGGWNGGSKERLAPTIRIDEALAAGISVAAINYRYVPQAVNAGIKPPVKAPLEDASRALQFIRSKATEWNLDKERIGVTGGSAGACSSLWLAFHDDLADPTNADPVRASQLASGVRPSPGHRLLWTQSR